MKPVEHVVLQDIPMSNRAFPLPQDLPVKITISGVAGIWMDEAAYNGLLETIRILQDDPTIVQSLKEREAGEFIDEDDVTRYV